ncbi:endolytic transglycosylase MltG [candidate division WOR-3 bacterium]|nr:endolytic transglycosylase MltG [candidate division WOR-3 bacterium]
MKIKTRLDFPLLLSAFLLSSAISCSLPFSGKSSTVDGKDTALFRIKSGSSVNSMMDEMEKEGILLKSDRKYFYRFIIDIKADRSISSGNYLFPVPSNPESLAQRIKRGPVRRYVTIPEGLTIEETASILSQKADCDSILFTKLCRDSVFISSVLPLETFPKPPLSLEGFLFPSSYDFGFGTGPQRAIEDMISLHFIVTDSLNNPDKDILTYYEIIVLASLIEKEAKIDSERSLISSVYMNRLAADMPLQCDATVLYALGGHKEKVYFSDLEVVSPYNTYMHKGLPPGPICSPGKKSIEAAMNPDRTSFLYYVARNDGSHVFSATYAEHVKAVNESRNRMGGRR